MPFKPTSILLSPTENCTLRCSHCDVVRSKRVISKRLVEKLIHDAAKNNIKRIGFTGGVPFLALPILEVAIKASIEHGMFFDRIMTNTAWFRSRGALVGALKKVHEAGYDGSFCISVDAFHKQNIMSVRDFILTVIDIWKRPDIVEIAYIRDAKTIATKKKLESLAKLLNAKLVRFALSHASIKSPELFIKLSPIDLSPTGKTKGLKNPWGKRWFIDDLCKGPGNVLYVLSNGEVKPCCGYATNSKVLTIGNVRRDSVRQIIENAGKNRFVKTVFSSGLGEIRKRLEKMGCRFPGKAENHCYFCHYILTKIPHSTLNKSLD